MSSRSSDSATQPEPEPGARAPRAEPEPEREPELAFLAHLLSAPRGNFPVVRVDLRSAFRQL